MTQITCTATRKTALVLEQYADETYERTNWIAVDEVTMETDFTVVAEASSLEEVLEQLREKGFTDVFRYDVEGERAVGGNLLKAAC